jgi:hypothetical protein
VHKYKHAQICVTYEEVERRPQAFWKEVAVTWLRGGRSGLEGSPNNVKLAFLYNSRARDKTVKLGSEETDDKGQDSVYPEHET